MQHRIAHLSMLTGNVAAKVLMANKVLESMIAYEDKPVLQGHSILQEIC